VKNKRDAAHGNQAETQFAYGKRAPFQKRFKNGGEKSVLHAR
jgi:hypothetical protein